MTGVTVFGAGAFGTALAIALAQDGRPVQLVARNAQSLINDRENRARLPGVPFPDALAVSSSAPVAHQVCLIAVPTQQLADFVEQNASQLAGRSVVACCKGVDIASGRGPTAMIRDAVPTALPAILSGPSFATDIARGLPTALTIAAEGGAEELQRYLSTATLRLYRTSDVAGVEAGGALKNVVAIAAGVAIGAGLGESARAAVVTRGYAEMVRFAAADGARPETLSGLSGLGDLLLTSTSEKSRNFRFGLALGRDEPLPTENTVEGVSTAIAVSKQAKLRDIEMPLTLIVAALVQRKLTVPAAIEALLARPLKEE